MRTLEVVCKRLQLNLERAAGIVFGEDMVVGKSAQVNDTALMRLGLFMQLEAYFTKFLPADAIKRMLSAVADKGYPPFTLFDNRYLFVTEPSVETMDTFLDVITGEWSSVDVVEAFAVVSIVPASLLPTIRHYVDTPDDGQDNQTAVSDAPT